MPEELAVETRGLTKQYDRKLAVDHLDLQVSLGEVYGLIGPNGAGKTTLIRMLAAAEDPSAGEIYIHGERLLRDHTQPTLKSRLGYLPDDFPLYDDLTVWDYLDYFARLYRLRGSACRQRIEAVLELVGLTEQRRSRTTELSRGMKQRLSLARAMIHDPILLLLDEPVSGLDPLARLQFRQVIKHLQAQEIAIFISSHVLSDLAELCTTIGIMDQGKLIESTPLQELYARRSHRQIVLSTLGELDRLHQELQSHGLVEDLELRPDQQQVHLRFSGGPEESAALLRSLVQANIPLTEFRVMQDDLETIFINLERQQSS